MAVTPTPVVDDDGSLGTGTVWNNTFQLLLETNINAALTAEQAVVRTVPHGGTGVATLTSNGVVVGNGASAVTVTAEGATNTFLAGVTGADPAFRAIAESDVTSLVADLALKAPLASPTLTGVPAAPTAAALTNTTQVATTAFVTAADIAYGIASHAWTAQAFAAGDYTSDVGTWVVASGDVLTNKYVLIGKWMVWSVETQTTTLTGTPGILNVLIPAGKTAAAGNVSFSSYISNNGTFGNGLVQLAGGTTARCFKTDLTAWANATDNSFVRFTIMFETT